MNIDEAISKAKKMREYAIEKAYELKDDIVKVEPTELNNITIGSVDGGLLKKSYHPFDMIIVSSLGVIYKYNNKSFDVLYYPSKFPEREFEFYIGKEFKFFSNLTRVKKELSTALNMIKKFDLNALILDGSIVPHPSLKPNKDSDLYEMYEEILAMYEEIYSLCKNNCLLAGVVKDSRSSHYFNDMRDTFVLSFILKDGERTKSFKYNETNLSDIKSKDDIFSFYIRSNKRSRPIRIDFLGNVNEEKISSLIYSISKFSSVGIPNTILECDKRVKLSEKDLSMIEKKLMAKFPRNLFLRRNGYLF